MEEQKKEEPAQRDVARPSIEIDIHDESEAIERSSQARAAARRKKEQPPAP